jgi:SAM-dependent methyltransferase
LSPHDLPDLPTASHRSTNDVVYALVESRLRPDSVVLDLGCGMGHMSRRIGRWFSSRGIDPASRVMASDISKERFSAHEVRFIQMDARHALPIAEGSLDCVVSIEVIEHISQPYEFLDQCRRLLKPGGLLVFSTPNVGNLQSRVRSLFMGLPSLYEMPSTDPANAGRLCGHIMPLNWAYLAYGLRRSRFTAFNLHMDQRKKSSTALLLLLWPFMWLGRHGLVRHTRRYDGAVFEENRQALMDINSHGTLTSRSIVVEATA